MCDPLGGRCVQNETVVCILRKQAVDHFLNAEKAGLVFLGQGFDGPGRRRHLRHSIERMVDDLAIAIA